MGKRERLAHPALRWCRSIGILFGGAALMTNHFGWSVEFVWVALVPVGMDCRLKRFDHFLSMGGHRSQIVRCLCPSVSGLCCACSLRIQTWWVGSDFPDGTDVAGIRQKLERLS
jgi:hypothetical protein